MSALTPVPIIDKNGRRTTVRKNLAGPVKASETRAAAAPTPPRPASAKRDADGFDSNGVHAETGTTVDPDGYTRETQFLREWEREGEFHGRTDDPDSPFVRWRHVAANLGWYGDDEALLRKVAELDDADVRTALSNNVNTPDDILRSIGTEQALRTLEAKAGKRGAVELFEWREQIEVELDLVANEYAGDIGNPDEDDVDEAIRRVLGRAGIEHSGSFSDDDLRDFIGYAQSKTERFREADEDEYAGQM
jgi:hypothetical protein